MQINTALEPRHEVEELVEKEVRQRTSGRIRGLQVRLIDGQLVITGRTSTYYAKQLVTHAALETAQDFGVLNEVEVC
jgi:hypothetical protein